MKCLMPVGIPGVSRSLTINLEGRSEYGTETIALSKCVAVYMVLGKLNFS